MTILINSQQNCSGRVIVTSRPEPNMMVGTNKNFQPAGSLPSR